MFEIVASLFYLSHYHCYVVQLVIILTEINDICRNNIMEIHCKWEEIIKLWEGELVILWHRQ
jgi:hypothetical protein